MDLLHRLVICINFYKILQKRETSTTEIIGTTEKYFTDKNEKFYNDAINNQVYEMRK